MERIRNLVYDEKKKTIIQKLYLEGQIDASKWDEATDNELIKYFDLKILTFTAIPPPFVTEHLLYERTPEAVKLAELLIGSNSERATPYCDSLVGSGKTTFGYKFRQLLQVDTADYTKLLNAVYIYVLFRNDGDLSNPEYIVLETLARAVRRAASIDIVIDTSNIHLFVDSMCRAAGDCKFLFHLDEVGCFEAADLKFGVTMIDAIWSVSVLLRDRGHYVFLTGRSAVMHLFEQWKNFDSFKLISLPPLGIESVEKILIDHNAGHAVHLAQKIHSFTAGVPRAVVSVAVFYKLNSSFTTFDDHVGEILDCLNSYGVDTRSLDPESFRRCVELAWAKVPFSVDWSINREPIVSLLARIGLYRRDLPTDGTFEVVVPPYILALHRPSTRSLMAIWQQPDKGSRLEWSVRRVLHLRHIFLDCTTWCDLSLSILDNLNVVFPKERLTDSYVLPKIAKKNKWSENEVKKVMDRVHSRDLSTVSKSEFAIGALPTLMGHMKLGQYYQSADKSGTADGFLRCSEDTVLCWQFKNKKDPMKPSDGAVEARKCIIEGYKVYLLIICTEGIEGGDAVHHTEIVDEVTMVMLSKDNVNEFLGATNVMKLCSKNSLEDVSCRLYVSPNVTCSPSELRGHANSALYNRSRSNSKTSDASTSPMKSPSDKGSLLQKRGTSVDVETDAKISPDSQGKKRVRISESPTFVDEKTTLVSSSSSSSSSSSNSSATSGSVSSPVVKTGEGTANQGTNEYHTPPTTNSFYSFFGRLFPRGFM